MANDIYDMNLMLNTPGTSQRSLSDAGCYGIMQNTYAMSNKVGFKTTTPSLSGYKYVPWPGSATCYLTAYADGRITVTQDTTVATDYWFYLFGAGYDGSAYEVYCATGAGTGSVTGATRDAWITLGTSKQWGVPTNGDRTLYLYFRNSYFPQTNPGTIYLYAESVI